MINLECKKCGETKPLEEFPKNKSKKYGRDYDCKVCRKAYNDSWKLKRKEYRERNKEAIKSRERDYYHTNKPTMSENNRVYYLTRRGEDELFKLKHHMRCMINSALKSNGYGKKTKTHDMLGCGYEELIQHLNDNEYGFYYGCEGLDIDHIIPVSSADNEERLIELNHYTNLQLLPSIYNQFIKKDRVFDKIDFDKWYSENK